MLPAGIEKREEKILILIPALNEEVQIAGVIKQVKREVPGARVLVVNDGSSDQTVQKAMGAGAKVISLPFNMGYGVALQTGYKYALKYDFDYVLQMDGDGQHDPHSLQPLLQEIQNKEADVVIGSRFLGGRGYRVPLLRRMGMGLFGFIASRLSGVRITDPTSGFQALNRRAVQFYSRDTFPGDYPDADVLVMIHRAGFRMREVPVHMNANLEGRSMHSNMKPVYYIYKMLLSITLNMLRKKETG